MSGNGIQFPSTNPYFGMASYGQAPMDSANYSLMPQIARPEGIQMPGTGAGISLVPGITSPSASAAAPGIWDNLWGSALSKTGVDGVTQQGWLGPTLGVAQGVMNAFLGFKQYQLAKDSLAENKKQFDMNYDAQRRTTNAQMEDRQRARVASNPGAYQSVGDYMTQNRIR